MILLGLEACGGGVGVGSANPVDDDPTFAALLEWTQDRMWEWDVPGAAIAVVQDGKLAHVAGLGTKVFGTDDPVGPDTLFRVGSISKMFCGALAAEAAADGLIDLDAPASDWLGDLTLLPPHSFADLTLLQLASHTSGMQTTGLPNTCTTDPAQLADTFAELTPEWALWTEPGALFNYANQNFGLLGLAVERARGELYPDLAQRLLDDAGMSTATYDWTIANAGDHATGHTMSPLTGRPLSYRGLDGRACVASYPSGGLMASARDLGHLLEKLVNGGDGWVSPEAWEIMTTQGYDRTETSGYGFGLSNKEYRGYPAFSHGGTVGGYLAQVYALPTEGLAVAVLVNADMHVVTPWEPSSKPTERIVLHALDLFLGLDPAEEASTALDPSEWGRFVGSWHSDYDMGDVSVRLDGDTLIYTAGGEDHILLPYSAATFEYADPGSDGRISFPGVSFRARRDDGTYGLLSTEEGVGANVAAEAE